MMLKRLEELGSCEIRLALDGGFAISLRPLVPQEALVDNNRSQSMTKDLRIE